MVASPLPWRFPLAASMSRIDFGFGQVLPRPQVAIGKPPGGNCSFYGSWRDQLEACFGHEIRPPA